MSFDEQNMLAKTKGWLRNWAGMGRDLLFPPRCVSCDADLVPGTRELLLCQRCRQAIVPARWVTCQRCGAATPPDLPRPTTCVRCRATRPRFDGVVSLGSYQGDLRKVVLKMKRRGSEAISETMGRLLGEQRGELLAAMRPDAVVAVPMYWLRRWTRGTNSPDLVAEHLSRRLGVPLLTGVVLRVRNTLPQANLAPRERLHNVRGAFRVRAGRRLDGTRLLLVDDILTTGATSNEIARVLKEAGAAAVAVAVLARAEGKPPTPKR